MKHVYCVAHSGFVRWKVVQLNSRTLSIFHLRFIQNVYTQCLYVNNHSPGSFLCQRHLCLVWVPKITTSISILLFQVLYFGDDFGTKLWWIMSGLLKVLTETTEPCQLSDNRACKIEHITGCLSRLVASEPLHLFCWVPIPSLRAYGIISPPSMINRQV